jgi:hypothetical protein
MSEYQTFTFGSDDFINAIVKAKTDIGLPYPIGMSDTDFHIFILILKELALYGEVGRATRVAVADLLGTGTDDLEPIENWAWGWLSGIGETLNVEGV